MSNRIICDHIVYLKKLKYISLYTGKNMNLCVYHRSICISFFCKYKKCFHFARSFVIHYYVLCIICRAQRHFHSSGHCDFIIVGSCFQLLLYSSVYGSVGYWYYQGVLGPLQVPIPKLYEGLSAQGSWNDTSLSANNIFQCC